jgi:23S rRNA (uracil1939-C5)-methyltransferase
MKSFPPKAPETVLATITQDMPDRVESRCRHFGTCGGCQLQDLPYASQTAAKQAMLIDLLRNAGIHALPKIELHTADPWAYRNRARMRVQGDIIGYSRRASNDFLSIEECPITSPLLWHTASTLQAIIRENKAQWPKNTSSFELFVNDDESALQLSLLLDATVATVDREAPSALRKLCEQLQPQIPQLVGAGLSVAATPDRTQPKRIQESQRVEIARWGQPALDYTVAGRSYRITRNAFFQVNRYLTDTMVNLVTDQRGGALAWDLFAGAGLFSVPLTDRFEQVIAVEIGEPAATDLAAHLQACGPQHKAIRSTTQDFLETKTKQCGQTPDLIILDPPRAGLGYSVVRMLSQIEPREVVYVSCDAGTFARDAKPLIDSGYKLAALHLLDLFPQTFHTETIAVFRR